MEELALQEPELIGRDKELNKLKQSLDNAIAGEGSTTFIAGEAGIGKTRIVSELIKEAETKNVQLIQGWCLAESLEPLMPVKTALREAGMFHLVSGDPPPKIVSAYLVNDAGILISKAEREESGLDPDIFASMLQAVGDFVKDSLSMMDNASGAYLNTLGYGEYTILLRTSGTLSLATVIKGMNSEFLIGDMKGILADVGDSFDDWSGDLDDAEEVQPKISWFINSGKYDGRFLVDDAKIKQENLFDNILLGILRASMERPVLLFLDDLQWSDPSSLNLVHYLSRNTRENNVMIMGTYRPEDIVESHDGKMHQLETVMQNMSREDLADKIKLNRLGPEDTGMIINSALGKTSFDEKFLNKIYKETGGTPFFILEVVKLLMEDGSIAINDEGTWELKAELEELDVPSKVYDVVKRRLDRLIKEQREVLECASVVGEEFGSDVVASTIGLNRIQLLKNLSEIEKSHKLIHSFEKKYVFDHAKIREVLYNGIMDELKQEYHKIVANSITELHKDNLDHVMNELAYHYFEADDERAIEYLIKAGDMAKEGYANEEAMRLYDDAIKLSGNEANHDILEKLGDIQVITGEYDDAIESFEKANESTQDNEAKVRNLRKMGEVYEKKSEFEKAFNILAKAKELVKEGTAEYCRILLGEGSSYKKKGNYDKAMPLFLEAIEASKKIVGEQKDLGTALRAVGNIHLDQGRHDEALQYYEKSLAVMEELGDDWGIAAAIGNIGIVQNLKGNPDIALEFYERSLEIKEKMGIKDGIASALNNMGVMYMSKGNLDKALEFYKRSLKIKERIGDQSGIALSLGNISGMYSHKGDFDIALEYCERSLDILERIGDNSTIATPLNIFGDVYMHKGDLGLAQEFFQRSLKISEEMGDKHTAAMSLSNIGTMYMHKGNLDNALEFFEHGLKICLEIGEKRLPIHMYCGLTETHLGLEEAQNALEDAEKGLELAVDIGAKAEEGMSRRVLGMVNREIGNWNRAGEEFEKANHRFVEAGEKKECAMLSYERALLFKAKGEPDKAKEHLEKALSEFERMGMKLWVEKSKKALEELNQ